MEIYTTEEEQVERIKKWIKEYGPTIIISILIVVAGTFGWRFWMTHRETVSANASNSYEILLSNITNNDSDSTKAQAQALINEDAKTPYAKLAALILAKLDLQTGDMNGAVRQLQWVMQNAKTGSMKQIARNRLARVYIADNKAGDAVSLLQKINDDAYMTAIDAIRGDAWVALENYPMAQQAYQAALAILPANDDSRPLLLMKLQDLPASVDSKNNQVGV